MVFYHGNNFSTSVHFDIMFRPLSETLFILTQGKLAVDITFMRPNFARFLLSQNQSVQLRLLYVCVSPPLSPRGFQRVLYICKDSNYFSSLQYFFSFLQNNFKLRGVKDGRMEGWKNGRRKEEREKRSLGI